MSALTQRPQHLMAGVASLWRQALLAHHIVVGKLLERIGNHDVILGHDGLVARLQRIIIQWPLAGQQAGIFAALRQRLGAVLSRAKGVLNGLQRGNTLPSLTPWLAALAIVLLYIGAAALDDPTDHSTEVAQAQALDDAHKAAQARRRFELAAAHACGGENAAWAELDGATVQCRTKHGRKTIVAKVQP